MILPCGCDTEKRTHCAEGLRLLEAATKALVQCCGDPDSQELADSFREAHRAHLRHMHRKEDGSDDVS